MDLKSNHNDGIDGRDNMPATSGPSQHSRQQHLGGKQNKWACVWKWIKEFPWAHPVIFNLLLIIIASFILLWILGHYMSTWTRHGQEVKVPTVSEMPLNVAANSLERNGFKYEVIDSVFEANVNPGCVVTQVPAGGSTVKPGRTVYLTVLSTSPKTVSVPEFMNVSLRQAMASFQGIGIKDVRVRYVPSEYQDLVLGAKVDGRDLRRGDRIPQASVVTLEVGESIPDEEDTVDMEEYEVISDGPDIDDILDLND